MGINSVNDKFNDMDRVNEIIGHLRDEEYDAVLYGVMLRFLKDKAKEHNLYFEHLTLSVDEDRQSIEVYSDRNSRGDIGCYLVDEVITNEA